MQFALMGMNMGKGGAGCEEVIRCLTASSAIRCMSKLELAQNLMNMASKSSSNCL